MVSAPQTYDHQFVAVEQQKEATLAGMWVFLASEIMFFGALFFSYLVYAWLYPEVFVHFSRKLHVLWGGINTGILLTSSWTMVMAVHAAEHKERKRAVAFLAPTGLLGCLFLGIKGYEWYEAITSGYFPGSDTIDPYQGQTFFRLYFIMTGFHGLHVFIGVILIGVLGFLTLRRQQPTLSQQHFTHNLGLYWHFVDIIWIFLFPLLYLMDKPRLPW